jgi:arabinogalactan endo-1,4-beta-galactosidase
MCYIEERTALCTLEPKDMIYFQLLPKLQNTLFLAISALAILVPSPASAQFASGADVGWLSQMESQKYVFNDEAGVPGDCLDILRSKGINSLRLRVWVNPSDGWCGKQDVAAMAYRADSLGFRVMLDFHMSDTWADPGHQSKPAAWVNDPLPQLLANISNHVQELLDTLKLIGVVPAWVQIGNETSDGMLWEDGRASTHMASFAAMIKAGYNAVKAVDTTIQVIVHLPDGHNDALYRWLFDGLKSNGARWDIIGMSVYPYWANLTWAVDDSLVLVTMKDLIARYTTKVMVVEAGYLYDQPVAANLFLRDLIEKTKSVGGLGVFYWEPEYYGGGSPGFGYTLSAWDPVTRKPTGALDAFLGLGPAAVVSHDETVPGHELAVFPNPFNPSTNIRYQISDIRYLKLVVYDLLGREVAVLVDEKKEPGRYSVTWNATGMASGIYFCRLSSGGQTAVRRMVIMR